MGVVDSIDVVGNRGSCVHASGCGRGAMAMTEPDAARPGQKTPPLWAVSMLLGETARRLRILHAGYADSP